MLSPNETVQNIVALGSGDFSPTKYLHKIYFLHRKKPKLLPTQSF